MLLAEIAATSIEVGALSARRAKVTRVAATLSALDSPADIAVVVAWLSGELPQRQIGVGWAALRTLPAPAASASLTVRGRGRRVLGDQGTRRARVAGPAGRSVARVVRCRHRR